MHPRVKGRVGSIFICGIYGVFAGMLLATAPLAGQNSGPNGSASTGGASSTSSNGAGSGNPATQGLQSGGGSFNQNSFSGSVPEGKTTSEKLQVSFQGAIDRALRNNLGVLLQSDSLLNARGQKWKELSALLPNLNATATESAAQIDLPAQGLRFTIPGASKVVGPIGIFDSRVYLTQSVFNWNLINRERSAAAEEQVSKYTYKDARDLVVLSTGNAYLMAIATAARVDTTLAQVQTAQALYDKTSAQQQAGISPAIDALRSRVELQTRQQELIVARNDLAKQLLSLARIIGLPPGQPFELSDKVPYRPLAAITVDEALQRAYGSRSDYQAAMQQVRAAQYSVRAATAERYPSVGITGNYGAAGIRLGSSHGVFEVGASLNIPIFQGGKAHGDILQSQATLHQSQQQLENLRGQIDYDVRTALLDLGAAADQVEVARSNVDLAGETLTQARDRFAAGVTDNLEVVQAQEALASANQNYISSLYSHNLAKVELARAIGFAEVGVRDYLKSN